MSEDVPDRMSENIPDRMSEDMETCQKRNVRRYARTMSKNVIKYARKYRNRVSIHAQNCQIEVSWWGSLERK